MTSQHTAALLAIYMTIAVVILLLNLVSIVVIIRHKVLRMSTQYGMVSVSIADSLFGFSTLISCIYLLASGKMDTVICQGCAFLSSLSMTASVFNLTFLAIDRWLAATFPFKNKTIMTKKRVTAVISVIWCMCVVLWILPLIGVGGYKYNSTEMVCYFDLTVHPTQWLVYMGLIFAPSFLVIALCGIYVMKVVRDASRRVTTQQQTAQQSAGAQNARVFKMICVIMMLFYISWLPFCIEHLAKAIQIDLHIPDWIEIAMYVLAQTNSFWNPIIFLAASRPFREALIRSLKCKQAVAPAPVTHTLSVPGQQVQNSNQSGPIALASAA